MSLFLSVVSKFKVASTSSTPRFCDVYLDQLVSKIKRDISRNHMVSLLKQVFSKTKSRLSPCCCYTSKYAQFYLIFKVFFKM